MDWYREENPRYEQDVADYDFEHFGVDYDAHYEYEQDDFFEYPQDYQAENRDYGIYRDSEFLHTEPVDEHYPHVARRDRDEQRQFIGRNGRHTRPLMETLHARPLPRHKSLDNIQSGSRGRGRNNNRGQMPVRGRGRGRGQGTGRGQNKLPLLANDHQRPGKKPPLVKEGLLGEAPPRINRDVEELNDIAKPTTSLLPDPPSSMKIPLNDSGIDTKQGTKPGLLPTPLITSRETTENFLQQKQKEEETPHEEDLTNYSNQSYCECCNIQFKSIATYDNHKQGLMHSQKLKELTNKKNIKKGVTSKPISLLAEPDIPPLMSVPSAPGPDSSDPVDVYQDPKDYYRHGNDNVQPLRHADDFELFTGQERKNVESYDINALSQFGITREMLDEANLVPVNTPVRERDLKPEDVGRKRFPNEFQCKLCDIRCTGPQSFQAHLSGAKHRCNVGAYFNSGKSTVKKTHVKLVPSLRKPLSLELVRAVNEAVIGLNFITEFHKTDPKAVMICVCNLCELKCDEHTIVSHLLGNKHRLNYMKEHCMEYFNHCKRYGDKRNLQTMIEDLSVNIESVDGRGVPTVKMIVEKEVEEELGEGRALLKAPLLPTPSKRIATTTTSNEAAIKKSRMIPEAIMVDARNDDQFQQRRTPFEGNMTSERPTYRQDSYTENPYSIKPDDPSQQLHNDKLIEEKIENEVQARLQKILSMRKPDEAANSKTKMSGSGMSSMSVLMQSLSNSLISNEDEAEMALQVSNALTQALLAYRMKTLPAEMLREVIPTSSDIFKSLSSRPAASNVSSDTTGGNYNQNMSSNSTSAKKQKSTKQQSTEDSSQKTDTTDCNMSSWSGYSIDSRLDSLQMNFLGTEPTSSQNIPTGNAYHLYANDPYYQSIPSEYRDFIDSSQSGWPQLNPPLPDMDPPKPPPPP